MFYNLKYERIDDEESIVFTIKVNLAQSRSYINDIIEFLKIFMCETIARRIIAAILLCIGIPRNLLVDLNICSLRSAGTYARTINNGKLQELFSIKKGSGRVAFFKKSKNGYVNDIIDLMESHNFYSIAEVRKAMKEEFDINPSLSSVRYIMKKLGYKWLKCGSLPAKADVKTQRQFFEEKLHPYMEAAQNGQCHLLFMDAAHFVFGCGFLGKVYCRTRRFIKTHCGRMRYNVLGALDYFTKEVLTVTNLEYITATQIIGMFDKIKQKYANEVGPIIIILDNARYQKCTAVTDAAINCDIDLVYLPSYSPNLNLIERLWKYVKSDIRANITNIADFKAFQAHIDKVLSETASVRLNKIESLIGDKVQLFDDVPIAS